MYRPLSYYHNINYKITTWALVTLPENWEGSSHYFISALAKMRGVVEISTLKWYDHKKADL